MNFRRVLSGILSCCFALSVLTISMSKESAFATTDETDAITYLQQNGILKGAPNGDLHLDNALTVEQLCIMLCRAAAIDSDDPVATAYSYNWIDAQAMQSKTSPLTYSNFYAIVFCGFSIPVYSAKLYDESEVEQFPSAILRVVSKLDLPYNTALFQPVSRKDAAIAFYKLLTCAINITPPQLMNAIMIVNTDNRMLNSYLLELAHIPEPVLTSFREEGWSYHIDVNHLSKIQSQVQGSRIGATSYSQKAIYVSEPQATMHEFGHFLDDQLGFPSSRTDIYGEAKHSGLFLRSYAKSSPREYFAEAFAFWINTQGNEKTRSEFAQYCPKTYQYFLSLEKNNWK